MMAARPKPFRLSNMTQRIVTGLILIPIVLAFVLAGGWWYAGQIALGAVIAVLEFCRLGQSEAQRGSRVVAVGMSALVLLAFFLGSPPLVLVGLVGVGFGAALALARWRHDWRTSLGKALMTAAAILYIGFPAGLLVAIRLLPNGLMWTLVIFGVSAGTDSFAYFGGRLFGKTRLAPAISPTKTVEGALSGIMGGAVVGAIMLLLTGGLSPLYLAIVAAAALVAVGGDLLESSIKRAFRAKDSHLRGFDILPGHGGVLDRIDALIVVAVFCYFCIFLASTNG